MKSGNEFSENGDKSSNKEIFKKKKKTQTRKGIVPRTTMTTKPALEERRKNNKT